MEETVNLPQRLCMTLDHQPDQSLMTIHAPAWTYFSKNRIEERLQGWSALAVGDTFRVPVGQHWKNGDLIVSLPALPEGFLPLPQLTWEDFCIDSVRTILRQIGQALQQLHANDFYMGMVPLDLLYVHPISLEVKIDIQPFPTAHPFAHFILPDFPQPLVSRYALFPEFSAVADFYAFGQLVHWFLSGTLAHEAGLNERETAAFPPELARPLATLLKTPERFHSLAEICNHLQIDMKPFPSDAPATGRHSALLHPISSPIMPKEQAKLRQFLRQPSKRFLGLFCEDVALRHDIYFQHLTEVTDRHFWFVVKCKHLPFSTLHEVISRSLHITADILPSARPKLQQLAHHFSRIINQHHEGFRIYAALADWVNSFLHEILPIISNRAIYYVLEDCELFDEESQKVFVHFWQKYGNKLTGLHILFSGKHRPRLISARMITALTVGEKTQSLYEHLLLSQLGKAEPSLLATLSEILAVAKADFHHCPLLLSEWVRQGHLQFGTDGWFLTPQATSGDWPQAVRPIITKQLAKLSEMENKLLRFIACLPQPVRIQELLAANKVESDGLSTALIRLSRFGLLTVYSENHVYLHADIAQQVWEAREYLEQQRYRHKALEMLYRAYPASLPPLIELARQSCNERLLYFFLIKYYRQTRFLLSLQDRLKLLNELRALQLWLQRNKINCWDRQLYMVFLSLNQFTEAEQTALRLFQRTGDDYDRFSWMRVQLFLNQVDLQQLKHELSHYVQNWSKPLLERSRAADLLLYTDSFSPLGREEAQAIDMFYRNEFYPRRNELSVRIFAEFSIIYTIMLFQYFPEQEAWASALLNKLESLLQTSQHIDLLINLFNCYIFHSNVHLSRTYNQRQLETSRRYGYTTKEQLSCINGMELSVFHGDLAGFRYHLAQLQQTGNVKRWDLQEQLLMHQLLYACEWEDWRTFAEITSQLARKQLTDFSQQQQALYESYAAYRRRQPLPEPFKWPLQNEFSLFQDGLYLADTGEIAAAMHAFKQSIAMNGYRLQSGWAYRELICLMIAQDSPDTELWLNRFEEFILNYGYQLFWPDLYRANAAWSLKRENAQRAMLYLRRAINGYQLIEKTGLQVQLGHELKRIVNPALPETVQKWGNDPMLAQLITEREQFLHQSLDLSVIIQLSQQVTKSLELSSTIQRLVHALFEYFPIQRLSICYRLNYLTETDTYSASGLIDDDELFRFQIAKRKLACRRYTLYQRDQQAITLEAYTAKIDGNELSHMEQFLSFIKPHIANTLLYTEMMIDDLTGFYQRRYFIERLTQEFGVAKLYGLDLSLIMIDLDNFRRVNEYGHQEGDKVLKEIAALVRSLLRKNDIPGRYGGEEMLLILPKTDGKVALKLAREIRQVIEESFAFGRPYVVTASIGVSSLETCNAASVDELIRLADDAEISAKTTGKNKVVAAWQSTE